MKLQQGQVWKCGDAYVRIVQLERLEVGYKSASNLKFSDGKHQHTSKKDFCRLLKGATLFAPAAGKTLATVADDPKVADHSAHAENGVVPPPGCTPAMGVKITNEIWTIERLINEATIC